MITYSKTTWGLHLLVRVYGSAFPRSIIFSGISSAITMALYVTKRPQLLSDWRHPYPYQIFAVIVGFIVVFRWARLQHSTSTSVMPRTAASWLSYNSAMGALPDNSLVAM